MAKVDRPMRLFSLVNVVDEGADESAQIWNFSFRLDLFQGRPDSPQARNLELLNLD